VSAADLMAGYLDNAERTRKLFEGDFYRTPDVAAQRGWHADVRRSRRRRVQGADYRISPFEIERVDRARSVAEAAARAELGSARAP
jgi:acyl-CoA synthetase (AMP-forming)/AMP-acid ligase II